MVDAISRCVQEENVMGWPLAYILSEYLVRTLQGMYGRDGAGTVEFIRELAQRVEGGTWPSQDSHDDRQFEAAVCGLHAIPSNNAADE
jgi:hypothetical protein